MWNQILKYFELCRLLLFNKIAKKKALVGGLPSTIHSESLLWSFRGWFVGITLPVGTGFVEDPVSRPTGSYKFAYLVLTPGRDARDMVPPFIIYHFGWVTSLCWMLQPPQKKTYALTSFFLVKDGEIKSRWMVQPNKTPVF